MITFRGALVVLTSWQMILGPIAVAAPNGDEADQIATFRRDQAGLQRQLEQNVRATEEAGWRYLDSEKREVRVTELPEILSKTGSYYAISPSVDGINARVGFHIKFEGTDEKEYRLRLDVYDQSLKKKITGRMLKFSTTEDTEKNVLRFRRSLRSIEDEVTRRKDELASLSGLNKALRWASLSLLPEAHADEAAKARGLADTLASVAGGAATIGVLVFFICDGYLYQNKQVKVRISVAILAVALVAYIASGVVHDQEKKAAAVEGNDR